MKKEEDRGPNVPGGCPPNLALAVILTIWAMIIHPKQVWKDIKG